MGIDPGTRCVGYGIVDQNGSETILVGRGTIRPSPNLPLPSRLREIFEGLSSLIEEHYPEVVAIEDVFAGKGSKSSIKIGEGRGVALVCAALGDVPVAEYTATRVKMATTGNGHASKQQVQKMVRALLRIDSGDLAEDEADALAIALCHGHRIGTADGAES
jgi:crossover junction endodeoxyribonuclease RuvC